MANWTWTDVRQGPRGSYDITASDDSAPVRSITFNAHKDRITPAEMVIVLQEKVTAMEDKKTDEENKLSWITANVDISGVS